MKGLSLTQPWATLVALGAKRYETRSWATRYRGLIAIHASQGLPGYAREVCTGTPFLDVLLGAGYGHVNELPRGAILAICRIARCVPVTVLDLEVDKLSDDEIDFGDYTPGRYAWQLTDLHRLAVPIPCKGALGLWTVPPDIAAALAPPAQGAAA